MCGDHEHSTPAAWSAPRAADGPAVDPVTLPEADEVAVTVLVDNFYDALLAPAPGVTRAPRDAGRVAAGQFAGGAAVAGLRAEHGFSALVTVRRGNTSSTLLFDTGASPDALAVNAERLGVDVGALQGVVLSHGHFDHAGGFDGLARLRGRSGLPLTAHPAIWTRRRLELPGGQALEMPTLSRGALEREGFEVIERRQPSLLAGAVLITGEVDRVTEFEHGMPAQHQAWDGHGWRHDPAVIDDQALVISVRGQGLVVITGCGHAGVVNIIRHAMRLTGVRRLLAVIGGFHLSGPAFEPVIAPTVAALTELAPALIAPGHCTGWRAQHTLAAALPHAWVQSSVGTTYTLSALSHGKWKSVRRQAPGPVAAAPGGLDPARVLRGEPVLHHLLRGHRAADGRQPVPLQLSAVAAAVLRRHGAQLRQPLRPAADGQAAVLEDDDLDRRGMERAVLRRGDLRDRPGQGVDQGARARLVRQHDRGRPGHLVRGILRRAQDTALRLRTRAEPALAAAAARHADPDGARAPVHRTGPAWASEAGRPRA